MEMSPCIRMHLNLGVEEGVTCDSGSRSSIPLFQNNIFLIALSDHYFDGFFLVTYQSCGSFSFSYTRNYICKETIRCLGSMGWQGTVNGAGERSQVSQHVRLDRLFVLPAEQKQWKVQMKMIMKMSEVASWTGGSRIIPP